MLIKMEDGTWINPHMITKIKTRGRQVFVRGPGDLDQVYYADTEEEAEELKDKLARQVNDAIIS